MLTSVMSVLYGSQNSDYVIKWLVFITEAGSVYCAVRTGYLNTFYIKFMLQLLVSVLSGAEQRRYTVYKKYTKVYTKSTIMHDEEQERNNSRTRTICGSRTRDMARGLG